MRTVIAWRILVHERARSILAVLGVFAAVVLVFLQLGFYNSVPIGATFVYEALEFDIVLISRDYTFQVRPGTFPRRRLMQTMALPEVESAQPFYQRYARWLNVDERRQREIFVMAFDPDHSIFRIPGLRDQAHELKQPYTALMDDQSSASFGGRAPGSVIELNGRRIKIVGEYHLGTGFLGRGAITISDHNFARLFRDQTLDDVHVGLIRLKRGANVEDVTRRLNAILPDDTVAMSRDTFHAREQRYWMTTTSTGLVFGFGTVVAAIVGATILFQTLSTLILRNLREYAVLKAIGYTDSYLGGIVVAQSVLISLLAFGPALAATYGLYDLARGATNLSIYMTETRIVSILAATLGLSILGAFFTLRLLKRADPADLF